MLVLAVLLMFLLASTWGMVGVIWFVQLVHYPLFSRIQNDFTHYATEHVARISWLVIPLMLIEAGCSLGLLLFWNSFEPIQIGLLCSGLVLLILIWGSTFLIQVPCHEKLMKQRNEEVITRLVRSNWIRTIAWSVRGVLVLLFLLTFAK